MRTVRDKPVIASTHAKERYAERVLGYDDIADAYGDGVSSHDIREATSESFEASVPCSLIQQSSNWGDDDGFNDVHGRIHPKTRVVWVFADKFDKKRGEYIRLLVSCWRFGGTHASISGMRYCRCCSHLWRPHRDDSGWGKCTECGASASNSVDSAEHFDIDTARRTRQRSRSHVAATDGGVRK